MSNLNASYATKIDPLALRVEARREQARRSLLAFTRYTFPDYQVNWHHAYLSQQLDRFVRGEVRRLIVEMPPRHGKSELVSRRLPAFALGRYPDKRVIISSYSADLANAMSRDTQRIIDSDAYRAVFPGTRLPGKGTKQKVTESVFDIADRRGGLRAAGVGGGITGMGADYIIIDDPLKDRAEAESETIRRGVFDWFTSTLYTRQEKGAGILITMTRWHLDDLVGRLLALQGEPDADQWQVVRFPALLERESDRSDGDARAIGEPLWAGKFDHAALRSIRATAGEYDWNALYQQTPIASSGGVFKRDNFQIIDTEPADIVRTARFWDLAMSSKTSADYTVGVKMGVTSTGRIIILDMVRFQREWDEVEPELAAVAVRDGATVDIGIEEIAYMTRAIGKMLARPELHRHTIRGIKPDKDKLTRALPFAARVGGQMVDVLRRSWTDALLDELCSFPMGKHDDIVDACSGAYHMLDTYTKTEVHSENPLFD